MKKTNKKEQKKEEVIEEPNIVVDPVEVEATEEQIDKCAVETFKHVKKVQEYMNLFIKDLINRSENHDNTKFEEPEKTGFAKHTAKLSKIEYGSEEYKNNLEKLKPTIEHHYSKNRHHPEHWPDGIKDMVLSDLVEMLSDWCAATERNLHGNIRKSIEINAEKYKITPQLRQIFENTVRELMNLAD